MNTESGRLSNVSERRNSMVEARATPLPRPGSAVDLILERLGAVQADNRESMAGMHANMGAIHADTRNSIEAIHADIRAVHSDIRAVGAAQVETRGVLETVIHRLERL